MNNEIVEVFKNIERHLKNISISLCAMEQIDWNSRREKENNATSICKLKRQYDFGNIDLSWDYDNDSSNS